MGDTADASRQQQFLEVVDREEATRRFHAHLQLEPLGSVNVPLAEALGCVLADDVVAGIDVPAFDRSNMDGFAVRAADLAGAMEEAPCSLAVNDEVLAPGTIATIEVSPGTGTPIATGGVVPRGADAVVMIEDTEYVEEDRRLLVTRAVAAGENVTFAGTDVSRGETVLRRGTIVTSREIGVLAAIGRTAVEVLQWPRVAVVSTGNEIVPPGEPLPTGSVYDSNLPILSAAIGELGCEAVPLGVVADDEERLRSVVQEALACDAVILSGGTSKGTGDLSYRVVSELGGPGIVAHGVALKPGKPVCLAVTNGKPVVVLPGFPTSAIFTFHEFVAPVLRAFAGRPPESHSTVSARVPMRINSARGRTEYVLVGLVHEPDGDGFVAYPMGKGSGSVTTFSAADGFLVIDQQTEFAPADGRHEVTLLDPSLKAADLVVIGSHCVGLDRILSRIVRRGFTVKVMHVGSTGGLEAAKRGECDIAGMHLLDPETGEYNRTLLPERVEHVPGYQRMQSFVFRHDDARFAGRSLDQAVAAATGDESCTMINRNAGSGTRYVVDELLGDVRPAGYLVQAKSHNAVATAVAQKRADWGIAIESVAATYGLGAIPVRAEHYDFAVPVARRDRPAVRAFLEALGDEGVRSELRELGFVPTESSGHAGGL